MALVLLLATALAGGCTSPTPMHSPRPAPTGTRSVEAAINCTRLQIHRAIGRFFRLWNNQDGDGLAALFTVHGELDFSTMTQNALANGADGGYTIAASRSKILTLADHQWKVGERLTHRRITVFVSSSPASTGADVGHVVAHFANGQSQPFSEAKFHYDCKQRLIPHAVLVSASIAKAGVT